MFTRLLHVKWCSYILDHAYLSFGLYFICLSGPYSSFVELLYIQCFVFKMVKSESFPIFMWLTAFTGYSETVFIIDDYWMFSYKTGLWLSYKSKVDFSEVWGAIHYDDVIMSEIASQITSLTIVYSAVYLDAYQRKYQSSASLAFVRGIHQGPVNSPHKWPVTRKMFPFDDVIVLCLSFVFYFAPLSFCNMLR